MTPPYDITAAEHLRRAREMEYLPELERNTRITEGVTQGRVIDARHRFDPDRVDVVTVTIFEGLFGPEDVA